MKTTSSIKIVIKWDYKESIDEFIKDIISLSSEDEYYGILKIKGFYLDKFVVISFKDNEQYVLYRGSELICKDGKIGLSNCIRIPIDKTRKWSIIYSLISLVSSLFLIFVSLFNEMNKSILPLIVIPLLILVLSILLNPIRRNILPIEKSDILDMYIIFISSLISSILSVRINEIELFIVIVALSVSSLIKFIAQLTRNLYIIRLVFSKKLVNTLFL